MCLPQRLPRGMSNLADIQEKDRFDVVMANPPFGGKERHEVQQNFPIRTGETAFLFLQHFIKILKAGGRGGIVIKNTFLSNTDNASVSLRKLLLESCNLHTVLDCPGGAFPGSGVKTVVLFFEKGSKTRKVWFYQLDPGRNLGKTKALKEGINDGFLTPFKVKQISTTLDEYVYVPDDKLIEGEIETNKRYLEEDFNKIIEIKEREAHRVKIFMDQINQSEKTLVFCATQDHALAVRDLINQMKTSKDPNYCQRVTANDGELGEQHLRDFQDNEKSIPTILTTSQKLSTGVDARNIRNIVLMRSINSMIEFKQIIGRGTRLYDGKDYFTIYDFVKAHHHFSDPEWDGEPLEPEPKQEPGPKGPPVAPEPRPERVSRPQRIKVKLADGKARTIQHMMVTSFWHPDGTPMSAQQFMEMLFGKLPDFFKNEAQLRALWSAPDTRAKLLKGLAEKGFGPEQMAEMQKIINAEKSDLFDVLAHVAYALPTLTREERAAHAKVGISAHFNSKQQVFLDFVLSHYVQEGVRELDQEKLTPLLRLKYHDSIADATADLGRPEEIGRVFAGFQKYLYEEAA